MNIAKLLAGVFSLLNKLADYLKERKLIEQGKTEAKMESLQDEQTKIAAARDAVANVDSLPVDKDSANRANKRKVRAVSEPKNH